MGIYHAVVARNIFSVASFRRCHSPPPPLPPTLSIPIWTHQFKADTNSSNRVRAAAVAFLAPHADGNTYSPRLLDRMKKKLEKQKKYLQLHAGNIDACVLLSTCHELRLIFLTILLMFCQGREFVGVPTA